ncbi:MAG: winged helix-turn-helix transcriptional regulator [Phycisphaeraceae bacterium]|nr:MAG: winged helix-turn-helix transcriptional regulator [Phycisphaeraceae bacterium]
MPDAPANASLISLDALADAAECLRTIAHPHRLRMIQMLLADRYTVGELAEACGIPSPAASGHLRLMKDRGFLDLEKEGRTVYYRIVEPQLRSIFGCVKSRFGCSAHAAESNRRDVEQSTENHDDR